VDWAVHLLKELGSVDYARKIALDFVEEAKRRLRHLRESREKRALSALVDFAVGRKT